VTGTLQDGYKNLIVNMQEGKTGEEGRGGERRI